MKPKYLVIGTIIALLIIMAVAMTLKSGKTSQDRLPATTNFDQ